MNKIKIVTLALAVSLALPVVAEAGPIRNALRRAKQVACGAASKVLPRSGACSKANSSKSSKGSKVRGGCENGQCQK